MNPTEGPYTEGPYVAELHLNSDRWAVRNTRDLLVADCGQDENPHSAAKGRVYKTIRWPRYAPCPNLNDPKMHPVRAKGEA